mmetsp:Transcript_13521/g.22508  ORF Transcript_13521/g.22508 Transcript_13521/m.22508 type:complete len:201 (-) Transcript_13521:1326-1928(-)
MRICSDVRRGIACTAVTNGAANVTPWLSQSPPSLLVAGVMDTSLLSSSVSVSVRESTSPSMSVITLRRSYLVSLDDQEVLKSSGSKSDVVESGGSGGDPRKGCPSLDPRRSIIMLLISCRASTFPSPVTLLFAILRPIIMFWRDRYERMMTVRSFALALTRLLASQALRSFEFLTASLARVKDARWKHIPHSTRRWIETT